MILLNYFFLDTADVASHAVEAPCIYRFVVVALGNFCDLITVKVSSDIWTDALAHSHTGVAETVHHVASSTSAGELHGCMYVCMDR